MLDRVRQTVMFFLNTDQRGNFTPIKFENAVHNIVNRKQEELLFDLNQAVNRQNRGLINGGLENIPDKIREKIQHYLEPSVSLTYAAGYFSLPSDLRYFDYVSHEGTEIEMSKSEREFRSVETTNPEEDYPIGLKQGSKISVLPDTIIADVKTSYIRNPKKAKWTYQLIDNVEVFNPSDPDFVDIDIHPSEENSIIIGVLQAFGVNLKEKDIQQAAQAERITEFNQQNQS